MARARKPTPGGVTLDQLLERFKVGNRTLTIVGKFRADDDADLRRHVFANGPAATEADGTLGADELFRVLRPELRAVTEGTIKVGGELFNSYDLAAPVDGADGQGQPILIDSPLLSDEAYTQPVAKNIQKQGGRLFKQLNDNLHILAQFWQSNFPKALLKVAKHYLLEFANTAVMADAKGKKELVAAADWYDMVSAEHGLSAALVKYLTCHQQDEPAALGQVGAALEEAAEARGVPLTPRQRELLVEGLERCKGSLRSEREYANDAVLAGLAGLDEFGFLKDYESNKKYGLGKVDGVGDKRFLSHFAYFLRTSDDVNRFVRTQALHSYLFCWLASKYYAHDNKTDVTLPVKMYAVGVEGQGDKRVPAETREERAKNDELIDEAEPELDGPATANYQEFADMNVYNLKEVLSASRVFTTKQLRDRLRRLFARIAQIAGGKAGKLLKENADFNAGYVKFYRSILNTREDKEKAYDLDLFKTRLKKLCAKPKPGEDDEAAFVDEVIALAGGDGAAKGKGKGKPAAAEKETPAALRRRVKEAFIRRFAVKSKSRFARAWLNNETQIDADEKLYLGLYDFHLGQEVAGGAEAGATGAIVTALSVPDLEDDEAALKPARDALKEARAASLERETLAAGSGTAAPPTAEMGRPEVLKGREVGDEAAIKVGAKTVGKLEIVDEGKAKVTLTGAAAALKNPKTEFVFKTGRKKKYSLGEVGEIPAFDDLAAGGEAEAQPPVPTNYERLSQAQDAINRKYRDKVEPQQDLNRGLRALLFGERAYSAPSAAVNLDTADLSCIIGLMIDMVEHLGDRRLGDALYDNAPSDKVDALLKRVNLSQYYPVANSNELAAIIQYHYALCEKLNAVSGYLKEVGELKRFFEAIKGSTLRVVLVNDTVSGHLEEAGDNSQLVIAADAPAVAYLTGQAGATAESLAALADRVAGAVGDTRDCPHARVPLLVSADPALNSAQVPLPLVCPSNVPLPFLVAAPKAKEKPAPPPAEAELKRLKSGPPLAVTTVVQQRPYLLLSTALLAPTADFGRTGATIGEGVKTWTRKNLGVKASNDEALAGYLRRLWLNTDPGLLLGNLTLTTWLNAAVVGKRHNPGWVLSAGLSRTLQQLFNTTAVQDGVFAELPRGDAFGLGTLPIYVLSPGDDAKLEAALNVQVNRTLDAGFGTHPPGEEPIEFDLDWPAGFQELLANQAH